MAIKSLDELRKLRNSLQSKIDLREKGESDEGITEILVGMATCGIAAGSRDTFNELLKIIEDKQLLNVRVVSVGCLGYCSMEPTLQISMPGRESLLYGKMTNDKILDLVTKVIIEKDYLKEDLLIKTFDKAGA
jgi:NADP-reducing hydrogenase subunit HndB